MIHSVSIYCLSDLNAIYKTFVYYCCLKIDDDGQFFFIFKHFSSLFQKENPQVMGEDKASEREGNPWFLFLSTEKYVNA